MSCSRKPVVYKLLKILRHHQLQTKKPSVDEIVAHLSHCCAICKVAIGVDVLGWRQRRAVDVRICSLLVSSKLGIANLDNRVAAGEIANISNVFRLWQSRAAHVRITSLLVASKESIAAPDNGCAISEVASVGPVFGL